MKQTTQITTGLTVDADMYEVAHWGILREHPTAGALAWERFTDPAHWWLIPARDGTASRAEFTLREDTTKTVKINVWFAPERPREKGKPQPHSHPWNFRSHILMGAYYEDRYTLEDGRVHSEHGIGHQLGEVHKMPKTVYHEVTGVWDPGRTLSLMVCGPGERGRWGHLDPDKGEHIPAKRDPQFLAKLKALNPHRS